MQSMGTSAWSGKTCRSVAYWTVVVWKIKVEAPQEIGTDISFEKTMSHSIVFNIDRRKRKKRDMDHEMIRGVAGKVYSKYIAGTEFDVGVSREDLIHAGVVGYLEAGQRLLKEKSKDSGSFYYLNVQGRMLDLVRKQALVRMPQIPYAKFKELLAAKKKLENKDISSSVSEQQLAEKLGWPVDEVQSLLASVPRVFSADRSSRPGESEDSDYYDTLLTARQNKTVQLDTVLKKEISELIQLCLDRLENAKQRLILAARYLEDMRLRELAVRFDCTEQAVHYQERKGLEQMRSCLEKNGWQWDER